MFDSSRQDDLLNRLKNCVGALKLQPPVQNTAPKQNTPAFKENQMQFKQPLTSYPLTSNPKMQNLGPVGYERKPMSSLNNESWSARNKYGADYIGDKYKQQILVNPKQNSYKTSLEQINANEELSRFKSGLNAYRTKQTEVALQIDKYRQIENLKQNQVKNNIARRYSQMQVQKNNTLSAAQSSYSYLRPNKMIEKSFEPSKIMPNQKIVETSKPPKYREELEQRKNLINDDYTLKKQKMVMIARKQVVPGNIRKQNICLSTQKQVLPTPEIVRPNFSTQQRYSAQKIQPNVSRTYQRPQVNETLKKSLENSEGDCTALTKLKKISELNEKINERIRNIINVFEQQK